MSAREVKNKAQRSIASKTGGVGGSPKVKIPIEEVLKAIRGKKVGVLTNGAFWIDEAGTDLAGVVKTVCPDPVLLYGEHGVRGDEGPASPDTGASDAYTGCRTRSLYEYGTSYRTDVIEDVDLLVVGVHDIGCRHYSYKRTMCYLMEIAARAKKPVLVVDAPNPIRGDIVEGNYPDLEYYGKSEIGKGSPYMWFGAPITYRHGMTIGELALLARAHFKLDLDLRIIKMEGWRRNMWWEDTGRLYLPFDPSIYSPETTRAFPCTGLFQATTVSWGIGTANPFAVIGAPWIKDDRLLCALQQRRIAGIAWTRAYFVPRWPEPGDKGILWRRFYGEPCNGVRIHFTNRDIASTAEAQLSLIVELCRLYPGEFGFIKNFDVRLEDQQWVPRFQAGEEVASMLAEWKAMSKQFEEIRGPYLLYK